jgi:hypothetical protein
MRRLRLVLSSLVTASLLAACGGANSGAPAGSIPQASSGALHIKPPRFLRLRHTPPRPPARRHQVTAAMRSRARNAGWQPLTAAAPFVNGAGSEILMTDGTVLVQDYCGTASNWYKLTPDSTGSYQNGKWSAIASMPSTYGPLYFASAVLPDGKLIVNGGEYNFCNGAETTLGAIYDPVANKWTAVSPPSGWPSIGDAQSVVLSNGTYMIGNCCQMDQAQLNEKNMTWTDVGTGKQDQNSEEGWTLLPNGDILTADVIDEPNSELFNPAKSAWSSAGTLPANLTQSEEIGPQTMRPNNTVFVAGASQYTAIYDGNTGKWTQGPNFPIINTQQFDVCDGPTSLLTDGAVLIASSPGCYATPAQFLLFNGKKLLTLVNPPNALNDSSYNIRLLLLPTGQILEADGSNDVEIFTSHRSPEAKIAPVITSVPSSLTAGSTYKISGMRFNGYSQANFYGDDDQQATNFPLVRITNTGSGQVVYARTHDVTYMGIGSTKKVSTMFDVPSTIKSGASSLVVVTNGISSSPVSVTIGSK